jgi:hypothetical protein
VYGSVGCDHVHFPVLFSSHVTIGDRGADDQLVMLGRVRSCSQDSLITLRAKWKSTCTMYDCLDGWYLVCWTFDIAWHCNSYYLL